MPFLIIFFLSIHFNIKITGNFFFTIYKSILIIVYSLIVYFQSPIAIFFFFFGAGNRLGA